jgi:hypothetical protein
VFGYCALRFGNGHLRTFPADSAWPYLPGLRAAKVNTPVPDPNPEPERTPSLSPGPGLPSDEVPAAPDKRETPYTSDAPHPEREMHYRLLERTSELVPRRPGIWRRLVQWLTGRQ